MAPLDGGGGDLSCAVRLAGGWNTRVRYLGATFVDPGSGGGDDWTDNTRGGTHVPQRKGLGQVGRCREPFPRVGMVRRFGGIDICLTQGPYHSLPSPRAVSGHARRYSLVKNEKFDPLTKL